MFLPVQISPPPLSTSAHPEHDRRHWDVLWNRPVFRAPPLDVTPLRDAPALPDGDSMYLNRTGK